MRRVRKKWNGPSVLTKKWISSTHARLERCSRIFRVSVVYSSPSRWRWHVILPSLYVFAFDDIVHALMIQERTSGRARKIERERDRTRIMREALWGREGVGAINTRRGWQGDGQHNWKQVWWCCLDCPIAFFWFHLENPSVGCYSLDLCILSVLCLMR